MPHPTCHNLARNPLKFPKNVPRASAGEKLLGGRAQHKSFRAQQKYNAAKKLTPPPPPVVLEID